MKAERPRAHQLRDLQRVQFRRKLAIAISGAVATSALLFCSSLWRSEESRIYLIIQHIGVALILTCIVGRTWCALYIGGKKKRTLIQDGPYSLVQHPLYVFSAIGALGAGAQWGAILVSLALACATMAILTGALRKEEAFLSLAFGQAYADYAERVPRFLPRFATWRDVEELTTKPTVVVRTFLDSCLFLLAIPIAQTIVWAQEVGHLLILLRLP